jgi:Flp pilus assembly protein TadD
MSVLAAERSFNQGLTALADQRHAEAAEHFRKAMEIEDRRDVTRRDMRYLSYYGLSLALAGGTSAAALRACQDAASSEPQKPVFQLNLGRVHSLYGESEQAIACFHKGASLAPAHGPLRRELARVARHLRTTPRLRGRTRPIHRWTDRIRNRWRGHVPRWLDVSRGRPAL